MFEKIIKYSILLLFTIASFSNLMSINLEYSHLAFLIIINIFAVIACCVLFLFFIVFDISELQEKIKIKQREKRNELEEIKKSINNLENKIDSLNKNKGEQMDFTQILENAKIINAKLKKPEPIIKSGGALHTGKPFLLRDIKTGDCKRYESVLDLKKELGYKLSNSSEGPNLKTIKKSKRFTNKYEWFAWEWELLACPRFNLM